MEPKQHLYLVDGSAYIFRAYHRLPPLTDPEGTPVGAVYGYTTMLWKLAEDLNKADGPTHLAVILDAGSESFRNDIYEDYKANRPPPPEDLVPQFPLIRDATRAFSLPCIEEQGFEADDLIASYAREAARQGWDVTIVSSDKDLMQLVGTCETGGGKVDMLDTMKNQRIDIPEVIEKFGVPPEKVGDVLALMGDSVDNVPGVYGVGPKTATKLIQEHGDLESALAAAPAMKKSKLQERLIEQAEQARLSKVLVTLKEDCTLPLSLDDFKLDAIPPEPLAAFLGKHGFTSLLKRLEGGTGSPARKTDLNPAKPVTAGAGGSEGASRQPLPEMPAVDYAAYECVQTVEALERWIERAHAAHMVAVDTETSMLDAMQADLCGVSLALGPNDACYIPLSHGGSDMFAEKPDQVPLDTAIALLKPLLESDAVLKVGQNIKYDLNVFARHGIHVAPIDDTMVVSFDLDAGRQIDGIGGGHGMDELSERHFGHKPMAFKDVCGTGKKAIPFGEVPLAKATHYAAEDADITWRLHTVLKPRLSDEGGTRIYERVDRPLIPVVAAMERHGIKVDRDRLAHLSSRFAEEIGVLETQIHEVAGQEFTVGSPKQLGEILFDEMALPGGVKGKTGAYGTGADVLEDLATEHELPGKVLDWRQLAKLKSTYTDALQDHINPETGRVHTSYSIAGANTGRLASTDPNLQNIPVRTEEGRRIREAFVAEKGKVLVSLDYSQIELRILAHVAGIEALKTAFREGHDIHAMTASEMFDVPLDQMTPDIRRQAKAINFGVIYGISGFGLARNLRIPRDQAQGFIDRYFERFPGIRAYMDNTMAFAKENGFVQTLFGRKIHTPEINAKGPGAGFARRAAINAPIQGTAADVIRRAMIRMDGAIGHLPAKMLLQVHDELLFEVDEAAADDLIGVAREVMEGAAAPAVKMDVALSVDAGRGANWAEAH